MKARYVYIIYLIAGIVAITSCKKDSDVGTPTKEESYFYGFMNIENNMVEYALGDTIWFNSDIENELTDSKTGKVIELENQTFILNGMVTLLKPEFDTLPFIYNNFHVIEDIGEIQLINIINTQDNTYNFDIRFGKPLHTNQVRFGLLLDYRGIMSVEYKSWVYYGSERNDYDDFSTDNSKGYIDFKFNTDELNDSIYYNLPIEYHNYFDSYYTPAKISERKFYFIEVVE